MKTTFLLLFSLVCISYYSDAQSKEALKNSTPEQRAKWLSDTMKTTLHLNADQYGKVYNINLSFAQKAQPVIQSDDSKFSKFRTLKDMQDKRDEDFKIVLTKDQYNLYAEKKDEM